MKKMILTIMLVVTMSGQCWGSDSENRRRDQALRLYQEGLFQEMGTGDHRQALAIYTEIAKTYDDMPDVAAVAYYHIGMLMYKSGKHNSAVRYFTIVMQRYPGQKSIIKRIKLKLQEIEGFSEPELIEEKGKPQTNVEKVPGISADKAVLPENNRDNRQWGIGVHTTGVHLRYYLSQGDTLCIELNTDYIERQWTVGGRLLLLNTINNTNGRLTFYPGLGLRLIDDDSSAAHIAIGAVMGAGWKFNDYISIDLDGGYYYKKKNNNRKNLTGELKAYFTYYF